MVWGEEGASLYPLGALMMVLDPESWARMEFSGCLLGDERRTKRLMRAAAQMIAKPDKSTPLQTESWGDCKAIYRLMDNEEVSFQAITSPHYQRIRQTGQPGETYLLLNDTTEINVGASRQVTGLRPVGRNIGKGFFLHSALMREPRSGAIIGLAGQDLYYRKASGAKGAKNTRRRDPERESAAWGRLIDQIGSPPEGVKWLHVCDRGADDYEVFIRAWRQRCGFVIRACRLNRLIERTEGEECSLEELLDQAEVMGSSKLAVPAKGKTPKRTANLELKFAPLFLPVPQVTNEWIQEHAPVDSLAMWVVELKEVDPPKNAEPIRWVLFTSERVDTVSQAMLIVDYYKQRWGIEEYHKALKTGCQVEHRYYETGERLERITGLLAIVAVQLLQIQSMARQQPDRPAQEVAPKEWIAMLAKVRKQFPKDRPATTSEFVKHLAGLGGHLGRKGDGPPGWITLWRGIESLLLMLRAAQ